MAGKPNDDLAADILNSILEQAGLNAMNIGIIGDQTESACSADSHDV